MPIPELKPCPFCGGRASYENFFDRQFRVVCRPENDCPVGNPKTRWFDDLETAAEVWNRRAPVMQGEVEFATQYFDGARWEMETNSFVNAEFARVNEEAARGCMAHLAARYPEVKYRLVSRQVGDWEPMDKEGGQP